MYRVGYYLQFQVATRGLRMYKEGDYFILKSFRDCHKIHAKD